MKLPAGESEQPNLRDLLVTEERTEPREGLVEHLERLKDQGFYDFQTESWYQGMSPTDELTNYDGIYSEVELLSVLVQAQLDRGQALARYQQLKTTALFIPTQNIWAESLSKQSIDRKPSPQTLTQLLGIICEAQFNQESAKQGLNRLKQTNFYSQDGNFWHDSPRAGWSFADTALMGILAKAQFDPTGAREEYHDLQATSFFLTTPVGQFWQGVRSDDGRAVSRSSIDTRNQLLSVLIELTIGEPSALAHYQRLQSCPGYHQEEQVWEYKLSDDGSGEKFQSGYNRLTFDQLLAALVEANLNEPIGPQADRSDLPVVLKY